LLHPHSYQGECSAVVSRASISLFLEDLPSEYCVPFTENADLAEIAWI
jgi:hypothetical protein